MKRLSEFFLSVLSLAWRTALLCLSCIATAQASDLHVVTEKLPPLNYSEQAQAQGYSVELVKLMLAHAKLQSNIQVLPWARAYQTALQQADTLIFSMTRLAEREHEFIWIGPLAPRLIYLYRVKQREDIALNQAADIHSYRIGLIRESASTKEFLRTSEVAREKVDFAPDIESNLRKLLLGRVDLIVAQDLSVTFYLRQMGLKTDSLVPVKLLDDQHTYYLAMNKHSSAQLVGKIRKAYAEIKNQGHFERLKLQYLQ